MESIISQAKVQYARLEEICGRIVESGNWQKVAASDVKLFLNMYVQSLLLRMAQEDGAMGEKIIAFAAQVPEKDILRLEGVSADAARTIAFKNRSFAQGTPLLLRCCVARDEKDGTQDSEEFIEALTRILQLQAACEDEMSPKELHFITTYMGQLRTFVSQRLGVRSGVFARKLTERFQPTFGIESTPKPAQHEEAAQPKEETKDDAKAEKEPTLEELRAELDELIGLDGVKKEVETLINLIRVRKMREEHGLKNMDMSFHMVFTGNPGTGKTTVARLVASIYKQLGFLSKGQLIETDRSGLVAGYVGQTAGKVTEVVQSALGGILFIDEAYSLARKGADNDFGKEAIDTLVKLMEDNRDDLVVIVAGYTGPMHDFLTSNPGLISRFNKYIDFPDYTDDELMDILQMRADKQGYIIEEDAKTHIRRMLLSMTLSERADFGNARGMRNVIEKMVQQQANRLAAEDGEMTVERLQTITKADAMAACPLGSEETEIPELHIPGQDEKREENQEGK